VGRRRSKFLSAYEKKPFSSFLFNAAVAFEKAKKLDRAVDFFQRISTRIRKPAMPPRSRPASKA